MELFYKILILADIVLFATFIVYLAVKATRSFKTRPQSVVSDTVDTLSEFDKNDVNASKTIKEDIVIGDLDEIKNIKKEQDKKKETNKAEKAE